ncbi:MAG: AAA family ATPase [Deltaproteobacteria bacterium]|nr:AAA family ATPase [Candidatus Zymogenaceae bacterium]
MILLDLVIVGVGRFAQPTRFSFHKGYTVVFGLNETGKTTVARAVMAVFYPDVYSRAPDFINWQLTGTSRAYVTVKEGNDVYRLTRDFSQKLSNLARYIPDKKTFALVTKDEKEISGFLTEKLGLFDEEICSSVFYSDFLHLPSTNPFGVTGLVPRPIPSVSPAASESGGSGEGDDEDPDSLKERLETLKEEITRGKEIDQIQVDLDELSAKVYEIQSKLKEVREIEAKLGEINAFFDRSKALGDIDGVKGRMDRYLESERRKDAHLNEVKSRRGQAEAELANTALPSLKDNKFLVPGGGIALGCIVLTILRPTIADFMPSTYEKIINLIFTAVNLGILVGLGLIAWGVWQFINAQNRIQGFRSTVGEADTDIRQIQGKFESETKDFRDIMRTLGANSVEELKARLAGVEQMGGKRMALEQRHQQLVKEHNVEALIREEAAAKKKVEDLESKLESLGALGYTHQEMKEEIKRIEKILKQKGIAVTPFNEGKGTATKGFGQDQKPSRFPGDHFSRLIAVATELVQKGRMEPLSELQKNFDKYIQVLSNNNYARSSISKEGVIKFMRGDNLMRVGLESMSPAAKDSMYFSLKFALIGSIISKKALPIIFDDPFLLFDDKRLAAVLTILKEISAKTQVIHLTSKQAAVKGADLSFQTK